MPRWVAASSSSGTAKLPSTSRLPPPAVPSGAAGTPCAAHRPAKSASDPGSHRDHQPRRRLAEQERELVARQADPAAVPAGQAGLGQRDGEPAVGHVVGRVQQAGPRRVGEQRRGSPFGIQIDGGRAAAEVTVRHLRPGRPAELGAGRAEQHHPRARAGEPDRHPAPHVVQHAEHPHHRGRVDGHLPGLVVEAHVAAGHRGAEPGAAVGEAPHRLGELPHDGRVLRRPEVQAVGDGDRAGAGGRHVPVRLGQRELGARVRVEQAVPPVAVGGERHPEAGQLVDPDHARVLRHREHGVAAHVPVVLLGHPGLVGQRRRAEQGQQRRAQLLPRPRPRQRGRVVGGQRVLAGRAGGGPVVHRALVGGGLRRDVHHLLAVPGQLQPAGARSPRR